MKVKSLSDFKDGFFINVKNSLEDIRYFNSDILSREIVYDENYCICFSECQDSIDKTSCIVTYGNHRGVNLQLLDYEVTVKKNFDYLKCVSGDFIFVSISKLKIIIFNSLESQCELFWIFHNSVLKASPYHHFINSNIDDRALAVLCYGESINPFADIKILRRGQLLILEKNHPVVIKSIEQKMFDTKQLQKYSLPELSDIAYGLLKKSVQKKIDSTSKIGLLLSGGIDSAAIARVLYDLDLNATFITWTSKNKRADEGKYTEKLSNYLGYDNIKINVDSEVGLLPKTTAKVFPYTHAVSSWWDAACEIAQDNGIDTLISGHYAAVFDGTFSLREYSHFKDRLKGAMNSYANPLFRGNLFVSHKGLLEKKYNENNVFRKVDIFTEDAKEAIFDYINRNESNSFNMKTQEYSYKLNLFDTYGLYHCAPYLDKNIISFCNALPQNYKNCYCDGQNINKVILRYSMLNRIPHDIISRYYSANLSYMTQVNLFDFFEDNPDYFDLDSILIKKGILDLDKVKSIIVSKSELQSNGILAIAVLVEEWLRKNNY